MKHKHVWIVRPKLISPDKEIFILDPKLVNGYNKLSPDSMNKEVSSQLV